MPSKDDKPATTYKPGFSNQDENDLPSGTSLVEVSYASDGTPSVKPDPCVVLATNEVIWRGARNESRPFKIAFVSKSPANIEQDPSPSSADNQTITGDLILDSRMAEGRHTSKLRTKQVRIPERFGYTIEANGVVAAAELIIDAPAGAPAIVIHR